MINDDVLCIYTYNFIAGLVRKEGFHLSFAIYFFFILLLKFVTRLTHHLSKRAFLICKLRMRRMLENDTDLRNFAPAKLWLGRAQGAYT